MKITSAAELESLLDAAELQLHRRKRWSMILVAVSTLLAIVLVTTSVRMVRNATRRTEQLERQASLAIAKETTATQELATVERQVSSAKAALESTRRAAENLGITLFHQRKYPAAIRAYDSALAVDPGNVYLVNLKGYAYFKMHDYAKAAETLEAAVQQDPSFAHAYVDLARVRCAAGNFDAARDAARTAIHLSRQEYVEMAADGEFIRLCHPIVHDLGLPVVPTE
jgi:tetratricopeptide (TPR) repeat protein